MALRFSSLVCTTTAVLLVLPLVYPVTGLSRSAARRADTPRPQLARSSLLQPKIPLDRARFAPDADAYNPYVRLGLLSEDEGEKSELRVAVSLTLVEKVGIGHSSLRVEVHCPYNVGINLFCSSIGFTRLVRHMHSQHNTLRLL